MLMPYLSTFIISNIQVTAPSHILRAKGVNEMRLKIKSQQCEHINYINVHETIAHVNEDGAYK